MLAKWDQVRESAARIQARAEPIADAGRADAAALRRRTNRPGQVARGPPRLIEAQNALLDAQWQSIQAYADLLAALGCTPLLASLPKEP